MVFWSLCATLGCKGSRNWLVVSHTKLEQEIQDVGALGEHYTVIGSNDRDSHKVMKFVHVFHLELPREEHLDFVDVS